MTVLRLRSAGILCHKHSSVNKFLPILCRWRSRDSSSHSPNPRFSNDSDPVSATPIKDTYLRTYLSSLTRPEEFWDKAASHLVWDKKYDSILDNSNPPFTKWFSGGKISACYNAVDRHCDEGHGEDLALLHDSPVTNSQVSFTYNQLKDQVSRFAGFLSRIGIKKGDRIIVYMPMIPEAVIAMLACGRIGAIHSVVFGGFSAKELATRISHAKAYAVVCGSFGIERGKKCDYKELVDRAVELAEHKPKHTVVFQRPGSPRMSLKDDDLDWEENMAQAKPVDCVPIDANDPLYILYTSGTTGKPKAVVRSVGGYAVVLHWSMYNVFGMKPGDVWWAASDFGWVVGHSYICYGPLFNRNPSVIYEGKPTGTPDPGSYFRTIEKFGVNGMFAAPTSVRSIRQEDPENAFGSVQNLKSLRYLFVAGEHCDEETKSWAKVAFGTPVLDNWWQTETGWPMTSTCVGLGSPLNGPPHSSGQAVPGYDIRVVDSDTGKQLRPNELGRIVVKLPLPPGTFSNLWENEENYKEIYFKKFPGFYDTMDAGTVDEDGNVTVLSRVDDIINVSGCRISTAAIEEAILRHPDLAECAVIGVKDSLKGQIPIGVLVLKHGSKKEESEVISEVVKIVRHDIGPIASFRNACVVAKLPKTRSGKIARPSLIEMAENRPVKVPTTIEDPTVYPEIKIAMQKIGYALSSANPAEKTATNN